MDTQWKSVVANLRAAMREIEEACGPNDIPVDLMNKVGDANHEMMTFPATSLVMLAEKMDLLVEQFGVEGLGNGEEVQYVYGDIQRLTGSEQSIRAWVALVAAYEAAREDELAWDRDHILPHFEGIDQENVLEWRKAAEPITQEMWENSERLLDVRCKAEEALMACPSPNAEAFAFKYLVAHGDGREAGEWDNMLEAEARRLCGRAPR